VCDFDEGWGAGLGLGKAECFDIRYDEGIFELERWSLSPAGRQQQFKIVDLIGEVQMRNL